MGDGTCIPYQDWQYLCRPLRVCCGHRHTLGLVSEGEVVILLDAGIGPLPGDQKVQGARLHGERRKVHLLGIVKTEMHWKVV